MKSKKPILNYTITIKKLEKDTYVVRGQDAWKINEVAERICILCDGKNTVSQIINKISKDYDVNVNEVEKDCMDLIESLQQQQVLKLM